jgi:tetratricopeptide (TPR) repeat protein
MEAEMAAVKTAFEAGVAADRAGNYDEAIAKFNEVAVKLPKCTECYANIGSIHMRKKEYELAEAAYKKAIDANPNSGEAYMGLANAYNAQRKFDLATEAGATANKLMGSGTAGAAGGASAGAVFNQGVIAWNAGKIPDAQKLFEQAVTLDPKLADAHYWLGMANVNQGKLPEAVKSFEEYLKLDAKGQYAEQAKSMLAAIKK